MPWLENHLLVAVKYTDAVVVSAAMEAKNTNATRQARILLFTFPALKPSAKVGFLPSTKLDRSAGQFIWLFSGWKGLFLVKIEGDIASFGASGANKTGFLGCLT